MENFRIDFTLSNPFPDGCKLGEGGEKNAAQLIITPPENLASRSEIRSYVVAFSTANGPVRIGPFPKAETLTVPVNNALTVGTALSVQLEGFDADGEFIIKSPVLTGITVANSIHDCPASDGSLPNNGNVIPGHMHENLSVLDSLSERNGNLTYKGADISSGKNIRTVELHSSDSSFLAMFEFPTSNCFALCVYNDAEGKPYVPDGAEIISVEMNINVKETEWVDLREMHRFAPYSPFILNCHKAFFCEDTNSIVIAMVYLPLDRNPFYEAAANYSVYGLRITYAEESGEA